MKKFFSRNKAIIFFFVALFAILTWIATQEDKQTEKESSIHFGYESTAEARAEFPQTSLAFVCSFSETCIIKSELEDNRALDFNPIDDETFYYNDSRRGHIALSQSVSDMLETARDYNLLVRVMHQLNLTIKQALDAGAYEDAYRVAYFFKDLLEEKGTQQTAELFIKHMLDPKNKPGRGTYLDAARLAKHEKLRELEIKVAFDLIKRTKGSLSRLSICQERNLGLDCEIDAAKHRCEHPSYFNQDAHYDKDTHLHVRLIKLASSENLCPQSTREYAADLAVFLAKHGAKQNLFRVCEYAGLTFETMKTLIVISGSKVAPSTFLAMKRRLPKGDPDNDFVQELIDNRLAQKTK